MLTDKHNTSQSNNEPSKEAFVAEVSHELRLPIANLKLLIETLLDGASNDPETLMKMLNRAKQEVDRLQHLVVDLLALEKASSIVDEVKRDYVLLEEKATYTANALASLAKSKSISIKLKIQPDFQIFANPEQLDQVLLNLVENAIKFTQEGGTVSICSGENPGTLLVTDTGLGIPQTEIPKIFQRFYRVDRTKLQGSTGLGLSIVKHIADLHGAKITVHSEEGKGSTFQIDFPFPNYSQL